MRKKHYLPLLLLLLLTAISLTACRPKDSPSQGSNSKTDKTANTNKKDKSSDENSGDTVTMEQYLLDEGVLTGTRAEKDASMIGAVDGFAYSNVEIYEYDMDSDIYQDIAETNTVTIEEFDMELTVEAINGPYVLIFSEGEFNEGITAVFNSYGQ